MHRLFKSVKLGFASILTALAILTTMALAFFTATSFATNTSRRTLARVRFTLGIGWIYFIYSHFKFLRMND